VLALCGCNVIDLGVVPTPTVEIMVRDLQAQGGVVISASHNPIEWNAFKLIDKNGMFLNQSQISTFFTMMERKDNHVLYKRWNKIGTIEKNFTADATHIAKVCSQLTLHQIKRKKFKVALDSVNGAGSEITQALLKKMKARCIPVHCHLTGTFPRIAEPLPENLKDLSEAVKASNADIGFAQDPDADRLAIVDEHGNPIGEEYTLALVTEHLLSKKIGPVVVNLSTSKAVEDIATKYNAPFYRSRVGEINVVETMRKKKARIGGEGNGGVISPEINFGRDSLAGIGYILEMMAERGQSLSELVKELPQYSMKKGKVSFEKAALKKIYASVKKEFKKDKISEIDGMRIDFNEHLQFKGGWVHLRPSNTEPVFRIIAEGIDQTQVKVIYNYFVKKMKT
jgi:phosphomannomutase